VLFGKINKSTTLNNIQPESEGMMLAMKKQKSLICLCLALVFLTTGLLTAGRAATSPEIPNYVPGQVIVGFKEISTQVKGAIRAMGGTIMDEIPQLKALVIKVTAGREEQFIQGVRIIAGVKYAERNGIVRALYTPNDPYWNQLWNMQKISADKAWDFQKGSLSIKVAVVDTGVDYTHQDLAANYVYGGYDWVNDDNDPKDDHFHGTHVAGTVAAVMDNQIGVVGVAQVSIWAEKVLNYLGSGSWDNVAQGITHATDGGVNVISMSLGGFQYSSVLDNACKYAWENGVLLVAAAGNSNLNIDIFKTYPASLPTVVAVSATTSSDQKASWSNYGNKIEVAAPGDGVYSTMPGNKYDYLSGTSMATPHVSGLAGLIWSIEPSLTNQEVRDRLHAAVDDIGSPGKDTYYGYGRINAFKGLMAPTKVIEHTYTFSIPPGGSWEQHSDLSGDLFGAATGTGYVDKYVMTLTTTEYVEMFVVDGGSMGDTMAVLVPPARYWSAMSPTMLYLNGTLGPSTYTFYVAYMVPNAGAFPAGYDIQVSAT